MDKQQVTLFTPEENAVFCAWLGMHPKKTGTMPSLEKSIKTLMAGYIDTEPYNCSMLEGIVGWTLLENADEDLLPTWGLLSPSGCIPRKRRDRSQHPDRKINLKPVHLISIQLNNNDPDAFIEECVYFLIWIPIFNKYVVTKSAPTTDIFEMCDYAIGFFNETTDIQGEVSTLLHTDWCKFRDETQQGKWKLLREGMLAREQVDLISEQVWPLHERYPEDRRLS